jgi:hypothetical protein
MTPDDLEDMMFLDSLSYCNNTVMPELIPAHAPFKRVIIPPEDMMLMPKLMLRLTVVLTQTIRTSKAGSDPLANPDVCLMRGKCLRQLKEIISNGVLQDLGVELFSVLSESRAPKTFE